MVAVNRQIADRKWRPGPHREVMFRLHFAKVLLKEEGVIRPEPVFVPLFCFQVPDIQEMPGKSVVINEPGRLLRKQPVNRG